ncbi:O-methyltransferase, family 3-containing protein [Strongyloides ratti]|uniref:O-methyltransferase, family 3-containing protein n=1 Tax=Strongyloides ratti TaxID=34506 RepID=A0A090N0E6_STRRB|nr:O-methyltransferase, family 3-containing protein [Strongyloides ratti]CEF70552.1 O-methyltransferase, family 3-containing protein [Strongyloides ratti]
MPLIPPGANLENIRNKSRNENVAKSYSSRANPIAKYCTDITVKQSQLEKEIMQNTLDNHQQSMMLGAPEVLQVGKNFIRLINAKRCLDIGTFTGASAVAWASAIPDDGKVYSFDVNHEALNSIGKPLIDGVEKIAKKISFVKGQALDFLDQSIANGESGTWDFAFIDADKPNYPNYYDRLMELLRPGGVILVDNALWSGRVADDECCDEATNAIRNLNTIISEDNRCDNMLFNVGDGLHVVFKL